MLFARPHQKNVVAVFDISSSSVAGAHVLLNRGSDGKQQALFLASSRVDAALSGDPDIARLIEHTAKNIDEVLVRLRKADIHHPDYIQVVLASPWYFSQTRTIMYAKTTPFVCTEKLVDGLLEKELAHAIATDTAGFGTEGVVVEKQLSSIKLNGYTTDKPYGKSATSLELSITITTVASVVMDRIITPLKRAYGDRNLGVTTAPFAAYIVTRDHFDHDECIVIDVGEEITDVAFVKNGLFLYQHSFPVGMYALYRGLDGTSILEAKTLFEGYRLGKLGGLGAQKVAAALGVFQDTWQKALQQVLDGGRYGFCLPERCYISADPRFEALLVAIVANDPFIQHACSRGVVRPVFLNEALLDAHVRAIDDVAVDIPLSIATLFAKRLIY
jgi:hypothetical protein